MLDVLLKYQSISESCFKLVLLFYVNPSKTPVVILSTKFYFQPMEYVSINITFVTTNNANRLVFEI